MSISFTPEERKQKFLDNRSLVHWWIQTNLNNINPSEYDDLVQVGMMGLIKAVDTFDPMKKREFSTYASVCIKNEIYMYFRKTKKPRNEILFNDCNYRSYDGEELDIESTLASDYNMEEEIVAQNFDKEIFSKAMAIILNFLKPLESIVVLYRISGVYTQKEIGHLLEVSQSYVSRLYKQAVKKIRAQIKKELDKCLEINVFTMERKGEKYKFSCESQTINRELESFLKEIKSPMIIEWKVNDEKERLEIFMKDDAKTFVVIAKFLQKMYGYK